MDRRSLDRCFSGDDAGLEFADMIGHAETIEQSSILHAHWELAPEDTAYDNVWICSNCGEDFTQHRKPKFIYCPNCGAKMDEEEDE